MHQDRSCFSADFAESVKLITLIRTCCRSHTPKPTPRAIGRAETPSLATWDPKLLKSPDTSPKYTAIAGFSVIYTHWSSKEDL
jgi:hypothetical protein